MPYGLFKSIMMRGVIIGLLFCLAVASAMPQKQVYAPMASLDAQGRIIGGVDANPGEFPYIVSLQYRFATLMAHVCGGVIITANKCVSAAHCFTEMPSVGRTEVRAGLTKLSETDYQRLSIRRTHIHPDYNGGVDSDDLAVIMVAGLWTFNDNVKPCALPERDAIPTGFGILAGWGATSGSTITPGLPDHLKKVMKPIIPYDECKNAIGPNTPLTERNVCTGPLTGGVSACSGDSGGPFVQQTSEGHVLCGIVSWGFVPCGSVNGASVHVRVSHYVPWINSAE